jgi:hypothetical protein
MRSTSRYRAALCGLCSSAIVAGFAGFASQRASAALFTLIDGNSIAQFDTATQSGNYNWTVDGSDVLAQQAFWYRIGNVAEQSVHLLPIAVQGTSDSNFDGSPDTLFVRYSGGGFGIETHYTLDGGLPGSGAADLTEQISITNLLNSPMDFHFFQYADFDLSSNADSLRFTNANTVQQSGGTSRLTETVATPAPSHHEGAVFPFTLNRLNDGLPTTLTDTPPIGTLFGPGDVAWAYEWDVTIPANSTFQISKDKQLSATVPEPSAAGILLGISAGLLNLREKRKRSVN